jgi:oxaloacetate decarboxylase (Na+ extruding) subunit alpha
VMDRIESLPRTRELRQEPGMPPLPELRRRIGPELSDEEFLLRATMPAGLVDAMKQSGPAEKIYNPDMVPVLNLMRELAQRRDITYLSVEKSGFKLELRSEGAPVEAQG